VTGDISGVDHLSALRADFDGLMALRDDVLKALEVARKEKLIGSELEAMVSIRASDGNYELLDRYRKDLRFLFVVSAVDLQNSGNGSGQLNVEITKAPGQKCERCWNYSLLVGTNAFYPGLCERCVAALEEIASEIPV
jgi:isoleucyl-tRNA synthetase